MKVHRLRRPILTTCALVVLLWLSVGCWGDLRTPLASPPPPPTMVALATTTPAEPTAAPTPQVSGQLTWDYPLQLTVGHEEIITVQIQPDRQLALANPEAGAFVPEAHLAIEPSAGDLAHNTITYNIPVYKIMAVQLSTADPDKFHIQTGSVAKQFMDARNGAFWTWNIVATEAGEHRITLHVLIYQDATSSEPLREIINNTRTITAQNQPLGEVVGQAFAANGLVMLGIGGPALLVLAGLGYLAFRRRRAAPPAPVSPVGQTSPTPSISNSGGIDIGGRSTVTSRDIVGGDVVYNVQKAESPDHDFQEYLDDLSALMLQQNLLTAPPDAQVRAVALARTLTILHSAQPASKTNVLRFLHDSNLITGSAPILTLANADLSSANLTGLAISVNLLLNVRSLLNCIMPDGRVWGGKAVGPYTVEELRGYFA